MENRAFFPCNWLLFKLPSLNCAKANVKFFLASRAEMSLVTLNLRLVKYFISVLSDFCGNYPRKNEWGSSSCVLCCWIKRTTTVVLSVRRAGAYKATGSLLNWIWRIPWWPPWLAPLHTATTIVCNSLQSPEVVPTTQSDCLWMTLRNPLIS